MVDAITFTFEGYDTPSLTVPLPSGAYVAELPRPSGRETAPVPVTVTSVTTPHGVWLPSSGTSHIGGVNVNYVPVGGGLTPAVASTVRFGLFLPDLHERMSPIVNTIKERLRARDEFLARRSYTLQLGRGGALLESSTHTVNCDMRVVVNTGTVRVEVFGWEGDGDARWCSGEHPDYDLPAQLSAATDYVLGLCGLERYPFAFNAYGTPQEIEALCVHDRARGESRKALRPYLDEAGGVWGRFVWDALKVLVALPR